MQLSSPYTGLYRFDFHDMPNIGTSSLGFGGTIEEVEEQTWRLTCDDGLVNEWHEDLPTIQAAFAYLGHLMDYAFREQYFEDTADQWLAKNWFGSWGEWARWHYRHLIADLATEIPAGDISVEDMGGGMFAVSIPIDGGFIWIDDAEVEDGDYRAYAYTFDADGDPLADEGSSMSDIDAVRFARDRYNALAEAEAVGAVLAQVEDFDRNAQRRILTDAMHTINVWERESR